MHIAVDETLSLAPEVARQLRECVRADAALEAVPFATSPAWFSADETARLASLARDLEDVMGDALPVLAAHPRLRRRLTPGPSALRLAEPPLGLRGAVSVAGWSEALHWLHDPRSPAPVVRIGPNGYLIQGKLRIVELNVHMMSSYVLDALSRAFLRHGPMRSLVDDKRPPRASALLAESLLRKSRALLPGAEPRVGVIHSPDASDTTPTHMIDALRAAGATVATVGPWQLGCSGGRLKVNGSWISLVVDEGNPRPLAGFSGPARLLAKACLTLAYATRAALVYPAPYEWVFSKAFVALVSDGSFDGLIKEPALSHVKDHFAWTRLTRPGPTRWLDGTIHELRQLSECQQRELVLKPAFGPDGLGVRLGDAADATTWRGWLDRAFATGDQVVQERLRPDVVEVVLSPPTCRRTRVIHDVCPVLVDGEVSAVRCRFSTSSMTGFGYNRSQRSEAYGLIPTWLATPHEARLPQ